ncbi:MAG: hypothetical protein JXR19_10905 [Bacteroidia bacterium]
MDRKEFILKSAGATAALAASKLLIAGNLLQDETELYSYVKKTEEIRDDIKYEVMYEFRIESTVKDNSMGEVLLTIEQTTEEGTFNDKAKYSSVVTKIKDKEKEGEGVKLVYSKPFELQESNDILPLSSLGTLRRKKYCILYYPETEEAKGKIKILDAKGKELLELEKYIFSAENADCFLTTVCVDHLGKADDCRELSLLRKLRDEYVLNLEEGSELVKSYNIYGPMMVERIMANSKRKEVLDCMYRDLVLPTVEYVENRQFKKALEYYVNYSRSLSKVLS